MDIFLYLLHIFSRTSAQFIFVVWGLRRRTRAATVCVFSQCIRSV